MTKILVVDDSNSIRDMVSFTLKSAGYQTVEAIRRQNRLSNVTVVALTAHGIEGVRERCLEAGMDDFMAKPYELSELQAMLSKYAEKQLPISQASSS